MKIRYNKLTWVMVAYALVFLSVIGIIFFIQHNNKKIETKKNIDITSVVAGVKQNHGTLEYESHNIKEFVSLVFNDNNTYESVIIDTKTGEYLTFNDLIKSSKMKDFQNKELELLKLKYPKFIVDGLSNTNGTKFYYVKDNEVIIFYYNYTFEPTYEEEISLIINYNEIKDYLNFTPVLDDYYTNQDGYEYDTNKKTIALTLDDGPSTTYNAQILKILNDNKAHATFFMVGSMMNSCQSCVVNTYASGNEIGSHTYDHINIKKKTIDEVNISLTKTNDLYYKLTNDSLKYLRPPYGSYNQDNLNNINSIFILWNKDTEDWRYKDADYIESYILDNVKDGDIFLMHELYPTSVEALARVLPKLYAMGYQVVSVGELAQIKNQTLEPNHVYSYIR